MRVLWTPGGGAIPVDREEVALPVEYLRMLMVLAETSADMDLGLHCSRCKENITGQNSMSDLVWRLECACRTFVGDNPSMTRH